MMEGLMVLYSFAPNLGASVLLGLARATEPGA
jgi:hypothetical protein